MEPTVKIPTEYAPAERATIDRVQEQARRFLSIPLVHQLLNAVPDIVLILNEHRQILFANKTLLDWLKLDTCDPVCGLRPGEALDCTHAFQSIGGCGTTEFCSLCGAVQAILSALRGVETIKECRIVQKNGVALDLQVWATPFKMDDEQFLFVTAKDISHEKRRRALERIFFHDILNTAGTVRGFADLLVGDLEPEMLQDIKQRIYRLSNTLIDEIKAQRELASAENGELLIHPIRVDALGCLQELVDLYSQHEASKERYLVIDPAAESALLITDKTLLGRVIGNMIKNALEAAKPGETVTLTCKVFETRVEFGVHNPSVMPHDVQLQVFQRSFSTKGVGRGLGTYSMKLLTERYLNGAVSFTSGVGQGTTFTASLPLELPDPGLLPPY